MVQLFYYENRGKQCENMLRHDGFPTMHVRLHAFEGWAQPALCSYWLVKFPWWSRRRCKIIQVSSGNRRQTVWGKVSFNTEGCMFITGKFPSAVITTSSPSNHNNKTNTVTAAPNEPSVRYEKQKKNNKKKSVAKRRKTLFDDPRYELLVSSDFEEDDDMGSESGECTVNLASPVQSAASQEKSRFCLYLTTDVSEADFYMGYSLTGTLQRGAKGSGESWELTHYAMVRRKGY